MDRILLLMSAQNYHDADLALRSARDNAAYAARLSFGLSLMEEPDAEALAAMRALGTVQFLSPAGDSWHGVTALWQGEGFILLGHEAMRFTHHWDIGILHALHQCQRGSLPECALTGYLPRPQDPVDAVYPVAVESFDAEGRLCFHRGTPLRYAKLPLPTGFLHPDFCFAPATFFQEMAEEDEPLFLSAFRRNWALYTLHKPLIQMAWDMPIPPILVAPADGRASGLTRFEKRFGLKVETRQLSGMARLGINTPDMTFPRHVPLMVRLQEHCHSMMNRRSKVTPLCVTAYLSLPVPGENLPEEYMNWFGRLAVLRNMSLLCYADSGTARRISPVYPNVLEYKRRYGLPVRIEVRPEDALNFLKLSKPFLLAQSREKFLNHSHYAWIDFGYLRYPVWEKASINWDALCTERIMLGMVNGVPDASMVVVPDERLLPLCRECAALCEQSIALGHGLMADTLLWQTLIHEHPDWFTTVELPQKRELLGLALLGREEEFHVLA